LHGWVSAQRIAHLNTNALQQLQSYFVSTNPMPYDRQLISDTFAIDDAFIDGTLMSQAGDWLITSYMVTNTQNAPAAICQVQDTYGQLINRLSIVCLCVIFFI
jgi:uncharacterized protein